MVIFQFFTKGIKAKLNELESDIFSQNEAKVGKSQLTPVVKALTNCALMQFSASYVSVATIFGIDDFELSNFEKSGNGHQ